MTTYLDTITESLRASGASIPESWGACVARHATAEHHACRRCTNPVLRYSELCATCDADACVIVLQDAQGTALEFSPWPIATLLTRDAARWDHGRPGERHSWPIERVLGL